MNSFEFKTKKHSGKYVIYCLKLESNKYYIGLTTDLKKRINCHISGRGAVFTKTYKPIELIEAIKYEGENSVVTAFELLGEIAISEIMVDEGVSIASEFFYKPRDSPVNRIAQR